MWRQNNENSKHLTAESKMILMSENIIHTNKADKLFLSIPNQKVQIPYQLNYIP